MLIRFDPQKSVYRDCRWCQGTGCLYCESEANKAYRAEFPDGPKPLATFNMSTPEGIAAARKVIGFEAITKAFSEGGGGMTEIVANLEEAKKTGEVS